MLVLPWEEAPQPFLRKPSSSRRVSKPVRPLSPKWGGGYSLVNDLLRTTYTLTDGVLRFDGAASLGLLPTDDLFRVTLSGGEAVGSSSMTLTGVKMIDLSGDAAAVRGSERFDGKALQAEYTYGGLGIVWRAILRNGSHYLRTELSLTPTDGDVAMYSLTPMCYRYDTDFSASLPEVVGNTRGAVVANDKIFAGLETPMGLNTLGYEGAAPTEAFSYNAWTADSWSWQPAETTPQGILNLGFSASEVVGYYGALTFSESGSTTVTFAYTSGTHRMNLVGVDVVDETSGDVVASDYHIGYTGNNKENNVYTLDIPAAGTYRVRYFGETKTETITSSGSITYSQSVSTPTLLGSGTSLSNAYTASDFTLTTTYPDAISGFQWASGGVSTFRMPVTVTSAPGELSVTFTMASGYYALAPYGVELIDAAGEVVASDYHFSKVNTSGAADGTDNTYTLTVPQEGDYTLCYYVHGGNLDATGTLDLTYTAADAQRILQGVWSRNTTLSAGTTWQVGSVVGLIAPGQARRSFLAYSERERAVPWRPMTIYNSWYELNIDRNNDADYHSHMTTASCLDVMEQWKTHLFDEQGSSVKAFVWDDGWDSYGTWTFNPNFPNGFSELDALGREMNSGIGTWLGPVGGYGNSGSLRRSYWADKGGMQLSNPDYYDVFLGACSNLIHSYDFRFFKFDGISTQFSSVGPDAGTTGEENAEGIIGIERAVRALKPDIFLNTTVGTWASPFWFQFTDAVWRQENDYGTIGDQGSDRERWITYRDRLVYQNFVQNSPLCPINTLMTHGVILTNYGSVSKDMTYDGVVREMRCAFACGSGMVELYTDYSLLNSINDGALWGDLAECIRWQEKNADVLPDIHWVGGNPWDGSAHVYGWASWNGRKSTLALRNPAASEQTFTTTLREALEIPDYITGSVTLTQAFERQDALPGLSVGTALDIDTPLTLTLPASSVFVYDGLDSDIAAGVETVTVESAVSSTSPLHYDLQGRRVQHPQRGLYIVNGQKTWRR